MTDEERQRLCDALRNTHPSRIMCKEAANEIEGLARESHILKLGMEAWPEILKDRDDRLAALAQSDAEDCGRCWKCLRGQEVTHLVVCPECGNKRCPHASDHKLACTNSNEPGQSGSVYGPPITQPDAEPVAWQTRAKGTKAWYCHPGRPDIDEEFYEARPLYTAPPRPDASAGLIEAAELAEQCANGSFSKNEAMYLRGFADRLRARAADAPPRPDASGLIEAAEIAEEWAEVDKACGAILITLAKALRTRAADRSGE